MEDVETLDLLEVLTAADARATSAKAWSRWRASLVAELAGRTRALLRGPSRPASRLRPVSGDARPTAAGTSGGARGTSEAEMSSTCASSPGRRARGSPVAAVDRVGLMADVAGALALLRIPVRAARAWPDDPSAVSVWEVDAARGGRRASA